MVETRMSVPGRNQARGTEPVNENPRNKNRQRRLQVLKDARGERGTIRVIPRDDKIRAVLKHQPSGLAFRAEGGASWPNDRFTQRRLRDGSIKLEPEKKQEKQPEKRGHQSSTTASS